MYILTNFISNANIECYGYRSCERASLIESSNSLINCGGSHSCYKANKIESINGDIECLGLSSCSNTGLIMNENGAIKCWADQACANSKIVTDTGTSDHNLGCSGENSCMNAKIIVRGSTATLSGHLAAQNAILYGNASLTKLNRTSVFVFQGFESGLNATIICNAENNNTCKLKCFGRSCHNVTVECTSLITRKSKFDNNETTICDIETDCSYAEYDSVNCPNGYKLPLYIENEIIAMPSMRGISENNLVVNSQEVINNTCYNGDYACENYQDSDCYGMRKHLESTIDDPSPICCMGSESCGNSVNISAYIDNGNSNSVSNSDSFSNSKSNINNSVAIRCDGYYGCSNVEYFIRSKNGGDIYCTAANCMSGGHSNVGCGTNSYGKYTNSNIFITGSNGCQEKFIQNGNNLYCHGNKSCSNSSLISNFNNIYAYGSESMTWNNLVENISNIYCGATMSCQGTTFDNIFGDVGVYGRNYRALGQTIISNVKGSVIGVGYQVLQSSLIWNVSDVFCLSNDSCRSATIRSIHNKIVAHGTNALNDSVIISEGGNSTNNGTGYLHIYINGTNDNEFDIYCNETDICKIDCQSSNSCTNLVLHCTNKSIDATSINTNCFVNCDSDNGIDCPSLGSEFNKWIVTTEPPTMLPTILPTTAPTQYRSHGGGENETSLYPSSVFAQNIANHTGTSRAPIATTRSSTFADTTTTTTSANTTPTELGVVVADSTQPKGATGETTDDGPNVESGDDKNGILDRQTLISISCAVIVVILFLVCGVIYRSRRNERKSSGTKLEAHVTDQSQMSTNSSTSTHGHTVINNTYIYNNSFHNDNKQINSNNNNNYNHNYNSNNSRSKVHKSRHSGIRKHVQDVEMSIPSREESSRGDDKGGSPNVEEKTVSNPLIAVVGIAKYKQKFLDDLDGIETDCDNLTDTFIKRYNYHVFYALENDEYVYTNDRDKVNSKRNYKLDWTRKQVIKFGKEARKHIVKNKHDGLIFALSCHGDEDNTIYTSRTDLKLELLCSVFEPGTGRNETIEESNHLFTIPKIFLIDSCRGRNAEKMKNIKPNDNKNNTNIEINDDDDKDDEKDEKQDESDDKKEQRVITDNKHNSINNINTNNSADKPKGVSNDVGSDMFKAIKLEELDTLQSDSVNFCKVFATTPGHIAAQNSGNGGFLLQSVCTVFKDKDAEKLTLQEMILRIRANTKLQASKYSSKENFTQTVENVDTLSYAFKFAPN